MLLVQYLNSQFSLAQNLDFFLRIIAACLCGALIGTERSKRFKEAGVRTHIIVCCGAALMMIISKYGFVDLTKLDGTDFSGVRGADSARIAAQVVSGISFLGAGVIFKHGNTVRGLTTAAGLWATAGIGLAIGAGMYPLGIFTAVLVAVLQILTHRFLVGADSLTSVHLQFSVQGGSEFSEQLSAYMQEQKIQLFDAKISYLDNGFASYDLIMRGHKEIPVSELTRFLRSCGELQNISYTLIN